MTVPTLVIIPASPAISLTVTPIGSILQFQVTGGTPPYGTWSSSLGAVATIDPNTGKATIKGLGTTAITITDAASKVAESDLVVGP